VAKDIKPIDYDDLSRRIAEEIRVILRELAAERGMSRDQYVEHLMGPSRMQQSNR
jgi:hypothetical protein